MMTRLSKPLIKIKQISWIINTTEIIMSIYVSANYNYRIEENVNFYLKMNYTSKTEDAVADNTRHCAPALALPSVSWTRDYS